jgi:hypothetical protein
VGNRRDLTAATRNGALSPPIGRERELDERTVQILSHRTKSNPVLIGEPAVAPPCGVVSPVNRRQLHGRARLRAVTPMVDGAPKTPAQRRSLGWVSAYPSLFGGEERT